MNRFGAFAVHLGISLVIFVILGYLILFHWYPDFFFASDGGWQGIRIVALVDLVLGPTLTLVVYKKGKPSLKFDLTTIAVLQAVCLTAGVYVVYAERPIAMVFSDGTFQSMTTDDYLEAGQPVPDFNQIAGPSPKWVSVILPEDPVAKSLAREEAFRRGISVKTFEEYYVSFDPAHVDISRDGLKTDELQARNQRTPFLEEFFQEHGGEIGNFVFLPFGTRYQLALIGMQKESGELAYVGVPGIMPGE